MYFVILFVMCVYFLQLCLLLNIVYSCFLFTVRSVIVFIFTSTSQFGANREYLCAIKCNSFSMTDLWLVNS